MRAQSAENFSFLTVGKVLYKIAMTFVSCSEQSGEFDLPRFIARCVNRGVFRNGMVRIMTRPLHNE